jgi:hypothetical protein
MKLVRVPYTDANGKILPWRDGTPVMCYVWK